MGIEGGVDRLPEILMSEFEYRKPFQMSISPSPEGGDISLVSIEHPPSGFESGFIILFLFTSFFLQFLNFFFGALFEGVFFLLESGSDIVGRLDPFDGVRAENFCQSFFGFFPPFVCLLIFFSALGLFFKSLGGVDVIIDSLIENFNLRMFLGDLLRQQINVMVLIVDGFLSGVGKSIERLRRRIGGCRPRDQKRNTDHNSARHET